MSSNKAVYKIQSEFAEFVKKIGGKDAALAIFETDGDLSEYVSELAKEKFAEAKTAVDFCSAIEKGKKIHAVANKDNYKWLYDIVCQYPTGAITAFDEVKTKSLSFTPDYVNGVVLILISREDLDYFKNNGMDIMSRVGMSFVN